MPRFAWLLLAPFIFATPTPAQVQDTCERQRNYALEIKRLHEEIPSYEIEAQVSANHPHRQILLDIIWETVGSTESPEEFASRIEDSCRSYEALRQNPIFNSTR